MSLRRYLVVIFSSAFIFLSYVIATGVGPLVIPFLAQYPPGTSWNDTKNCGPTSYLMVNSFYTKENITEQSIIDLNDWMFKNLGLPINRYNGNPINFEQIREISINFGNYKEEELRFIRDDKDIEGLAKHLNEGHPIIVLVHTNMGLRLRNSLHFMVLTGIEGDTVYVNDPGKGPGENNTYTLEQFVNSWSQNHYQALIFLPPNGEKEQPKIEPSTALQPQNPSPSLWQKTKNWIGSLWGGDENNSNTTQEQNQPPQEVKSEQEQRPEEQPKSVVNLSFINSPQSVQSTPGKTIQVTARVRNTGNQTLKRSDVSLNVIGGREANTVYFHSSWVTPLRPTLLDQQQIDPGKEGTFTFTFTTPPHTGSYAFELIAVETLGWKHMGSNSFVTNIQVAEQVLPPVEPAPIVQEPVNIPKENDSLWDKVIKGLKDVAEKTVDTIVNIPTYFGSSGGGSSATPAPSQDSNPEPESTSEQVTEEISLSVTNPSFSPVSYNTTTIVLAGEKTGNVDELCIEDVCSLFTSSTDTLWEHEISLSEGARELDIYGRGENANTSSTVLLVNVDITSPTQPIVQVSETANTSSLDIAWQSTDSGVGIDYVEIAYRPVSTTEWNVGMIDSSFSSYSIPVERGVSYEIHVRTIDKVGNTSVWSDDGNTQLISSLDWPKDVVINELAWAGISNIRSLCSSYYWLELYNTHADVISLEGWTLKLGDTNIPLRGSIAAHGYYLIESHEKSITSRSADVVASQLIFSPQGTYMVLRNAEGEIMDETNQSAGWWGGTSAPLYRSLERVDVAKPGNSLSNWKTSESIRYGVTSDNCGVVHGSPGMDNKTGWFLSNLANEYYTPDSQTLTLTVQHSPYLFDYEVTVPAGHTLTVEKDVELLAAYSGASFGVYGEMNIQGEKDHEVNITSLYDTTSTLPYDTSSRLPRPGDWSRISVYAGGIFNASYGRFAYGGSTSFGLQFISHVIHSEGGDIALDHNSFEHAYIGTDAKKKDAYVGTQGGVLSVNDTYFTTGTRAVFANNTEVSGKNNTFLGFVNDVYPVELQDAWPMLWETNTYTDNTRNYAYITGATIGHDSSMLFDENIRLGNITIGASSTLTIHSGSHLVFAPSSIMTIYGTLDASGTADNPISIGSTDNAFGYLLFDGGSGNFSYVSITKGGYLQAPSIFPNAGTFATIWARNAQLNFDNATITESRRPGVTMYLQNSTSTVYDASLGWTTSYNKISGWRDNGIRLKGGNLVLDNVFFNKMDYAVDASDGYVLSWNNLDVDHFVNMYYTQNATNWMPRDLFPFQLW